MDAKDYVASQAYESFVRLARLCEREEHGAHNSYMLNLIRKENGGGGGSHLSYEKLLSDVKQYMTGAAEFALTREMAAEDAVMIAFYLQRIKDADTSEELMEICNAGVAILINYKPGWTGE